MLRLGLTGGIGSGKSTVAQRLVELGAALVDTDALARSLTAAQGAALPARAGLFGHDVIDAQGALDRERLRAIVFADPAARLRLEGVLHPMIGDTAQRQAEAAQSRGAAALVFDVPLLTESHHWRARCDRILVVDCPIETQIARVMQRSGWPEAQVRQVIAQQATRAQRRAIADAVIVNDGLTLEALRAEVDALWHAWVGRQASVTPEAR